MRIAVNYSGLHTNRNQSRMQDSLVDFCGFANAAFVQVLNTVGSDLM